MSFPWKNRRRLNALLLGLAGVLCCGGTAFAAVTIRWYTFDPLAVGKTGTAGAKFSVLLEGSPTSARFDLVNGETVALSAAGGGIWTANLSHAQLLFGYGPEDVNRNFVGFLKTFEGTTLNEQLNVFVDVLDENIPSVVVATLASGVRSTRYVANIWMPNLPLAYDSQLQAIAQQFYQYFPDDFDFLNIVFALPGFRGGGGSGNRYHFQVKNAVFGIGSSQLNNTAFYGSAGRLQGISVFPVPSFFDMGETGSIHELGHQWINYLALPILKQGTPHWPASTLARGVMGLSIAGSNVGGAFPWDIVPAGGGYQYQSAAVTREFNDLDLYLMGLLPPAGVGNHLVAQNQSQQPCQGCAVAVSTVTINDIVGSQGARLPDASTSQKQFRYATLIVTRDRLLSNDELAFFHRFAARGEAAQPLPFSSGLAQGTTKPWAVATKGLSSLVGVLDQPGCAANATTLCLNGGRFQVRVSWRVPSQGTSGVGTAVPLTSDTGYFWFFSSNNVELMIKALDGRAFNNKFWVFYGALSDVEYTITVTDTATGVVKTYSNVSGTLASVADAAAFNGSPSVVTSPAEPEVRSPVSEVGAQPTSGFPGSIGVETSLPVRDGAPPPVTQSPSHPVGPLSGGRFTAPCAPDVTTLCLNAGRFQVRVNWSVPSQGTSGAGMAVPLTSDTGYLWFFSSNNVELVIKVVDGRVVNNKFWVFYGALSDVQYTITVTDTQTGATRTYNNPSGTLASVADTAAF
jgi:hypothetical protein